MDQEPPRSDERLTDRKPLTEDQLACRKKLDFLWKLSEYYLAQEAYAEEGMGEAWENASKVSSQQTT